MLLTDGYHVLERTLDRADIDALRAAIDECIDRVARAMLTPFDASCPGAVLEERLEIAARRDRAYASALLQAVMADAQHDPRIAAVREHPRLAAAVARALSPLAPTGSVVRTRAALPTFSARLSPWHQDVVRPDAGTGCATVRLACWIPLSDVEAETGALEVVPGRWTAPLPHHTSEQGHFEIPESLLPPADRRIVPMRCGDVLLLDRFVPHRARPVRGPAGRWSVVMWVKVAGGAA